MRRKSVITYTLLVVASCAATHLVTKLHMKNTKNMTLEEAIALKGTETLTPEQKHLVAAAIRRRVLEGVRHLKELRFQGGLAAIEAHNGLKQVLEDVK